MKEAENCALRLIYTCNPIDVEHGIHIGSFRHALGEELGRQMAEIFRRADARAAAGLSQEAQLQLRKMLETVCASIDAEEEEVL